MDVPRVKVEVEVKGVDVEAMLKVRLDRTLTTIDGSAHSWWPRAR